MGYKMPNVVKEIYLPFSSLEQKGVDVSLSVDKYKELYGIDLYDIFDFIEGNPFINIYCKLFVVNLDLTTNTGHIAKPVVDIILKDTNIWVLNGSRADSTFAIKVEDGIITGCGYYDNN